MHKPLGVVVKTAVGSVSTHKHMSYINWATASHHRTFHELDTGTF